MTACTIDALKALSNEEREVLGYIYINHDVGHPRATVESLLRKGWIIAYKETLTGSPPVQVTRYTFSCLKAHMLWCQWCAEQCEHETDIPFP